METFITRVPRFGSALNRALEYPYTAPEYSYTLQGSTLCRFLPEHTAKRQPILCVGSNIAPQQLVLKFNAQGTTPVQRAWLSGYDVVFAAMISHYASIPAMLVPRQNTSVYLAIAWLNEKQLQIMDATEEPAYRRTVLNNIDLTTREGQGYSSMMYYESRLPAYQSDNQMCAISDIVADHRSLPSLSVAELLVSIYQCLSQKHAPFSFNAFMTMLIEDGSFRQEITDIIRLHSQKILVDSSG